MNVYSIRDNDTDSFNTPFYNASEIGARRSVISAVPNSMLETFPHSFALYYLGTFNEKTGETKNTAPTMVAPIHQLLSEQKTKELKNEKK